MSKEASKFQEKFMSRLYRGKEIFKPLNTGWIDEHVACIREYVANIFFFTKNDTTIMIDAGYNYEQLEEKMSWLDIDPQQITDILITHQDTDHIGAVETDSDQLFSHATLYISEIENRYLTGEVRRRVMHGLYTLPQVYSANPRVMLQDGQTFELGGIKIEAMLVRGHTWGHMAFLIDDEYLFSGDAIWLGPDGGHSFIGTLAEDNELSLRSLIQLEQRLRERGLTPKVITGHTGWSDDLDFVFARKDHVVKSFRKQTPHDPEAPYDAYDESDDTETFARTVRLKKQSAQLLGGQAATSFAASSLSRTATPTRVYKSFEALARKLNIQAPYRQNTKAVLEHLQNSNSASNMPVQRMYRDFAIEEKSIADATTFVIRSREIPPTCRVLFIHGGGGMLRPTLFHYAFAKRLVRHNNAEVWMPFYPLAPEANFYDSLAACFANYQAMLTQDEALPIAFAGDSAGANLELAVCRQVLDQGIEAPRAIVCISPATGMEAQNYQESFAQQARISRDPLLCLEMVETIRLNWYKDVPLAGELSNPAYMDYTGFPPVLLYYGTAEIFYPATEAIRKRMEAENVDLSWVRGEKLMHDWALLNYFPEGMSAQREIRDFIRKHCS